MPVEIRELHITTTVSDAPAQTANNIPSAAMNMDNMVARCVEQVLDILKQKNER